MNKRNNSIEIIVNGEYIDLLQNDIGIKMSCELLDPTKLVSKSGEFSYTFDLPATSHNNKIFGNINVASKLNKFNKTFNAVIYSNNIKIIEGVISISDYDNDNKIYKCNIYKNKKNTIDEIFEEKHLNEINWYVPFDGAKTINAVNKDKNSKYFYPMVAYSLFQKKPSFVSKSGYMQYGDKSVIDLNTLFYYNSFVPSMNMVELMKKCFDSKGLTLAGDIVNDNVLNEIYLSNSISSDQDPVYNWGGNRGEVEIKYNFTNKIVITGETHGGVTKATYVGQNIEYPLDYVPDYDLGNYDTAFVWDALNTKGRRTFSNTQIIKNDGKWYDKENGAIQIPADGWYEITMTTASNADLQDELFNVYKVTQRGVFDNPDTYQNVMLQNNIDDKPFEIQLLRMDGDDGEGDNISHNIIATGDYPNEFDPVGVDYKTVPHYSNNPNKTLQAITTQVDGGYHQNFLMGNSFYKNGVSLGYIKNGYSYKNFDIYNESLFNCDGYYYIDEGKKTQTTYNKNTLINAKDTNQYDERTLVRAATQHMTVYLHKNDILKLYAQTRGYFDEEGKKLFYKINARGTLKIRALSPQDKVNKNDIIYGMESRFDKELNLANFINKEELMKNYINNIMKTFNLYMERDNNIIYINKNKINNNYTSPINIDDKASINDAIFSKINFPSTMECQWTIDTDEEGYYLSALANATDEQIQSENWKDYGDTGSEKITLNNDNKELVNKSQFSYNWKKKFYLFSYPDWKEKYDAATSTGDKINIPLEYLVMYFPVIGKREWWVEGTDYQKNAQKDGRSFKQRLWFRGEVRDNYRRVPIDVSWQEATEADFVNITDCDNSKYINGEYYYLNYNIGENTLLNNYFNAIANVNGNEVEIECYLTPEEYYAIKRGQSVKFDDDLYLVEKIDNFDIEQKSPTKLKLLKL